MRGGMRRGTAGSVSVFVFRSDRLPRKTMLGLLPSSLMKPSGSRRHPSTHPASTSTAAACTTTPPIHPQTSSSSRTRSPDKTHTRTHTHTGLNGLLYTSGKQRLSKASAAPPYLCCALIVSGGFLFGRVFFSLHPRTKRRNERRRKSSFQFCLLLDFCLFLSSWIEGSHSSPELGLGETALAAVWNV